MSVHVRELAVGMYESDGVSTPIPGVVNVDVKIAGVTQTTSHHGVGLRSHCGVVDILVEMVPAVPAHRRSGSQLYRLMGENGGQKQSRKSHYSPIPARESCHELLLDIRCFSSRTASV